MNKRMISIFVLIYSLTIPFSQSFALQSKKMKDGDQAQVDFSEHDTSRIFIGSGGRIEEIFGKGSGFVEITKDEVKGQVFVSITKKPDRPIGLFVRDSNGNTYSLIANVKDIPSTTIRIDPASFKSEVKSEAENKSDPMKRRVKNIMRTLIKKDMTKGNWIEGDGIILPIWKDLEATLLHEVRFGDLIGEIYRVRSLSNERREVSETDFLVIGDEIRAITTSRRSLSRNQSLELYIVRNNTGS